MATKNKNFIYGIFDDADTVIHTVESLRKQGVDIHDCYTPYPVHGLDRAMGIKRSKLTIGAFICGSIGCCLAIFMQMYMMAADWPMIIGGKPNDGYYPSFIPVTFEMTVLFTAFGMAALFFIRTKLIHGKVERLFELRQTDDLFIIAIEEKGRHFDKEAINRTLMTEGALEIKEREFSK